MDNGVLSHIDWLLSTAQKSSIDYRITPILTRHQILSTMAPAIRQIICVDGTWCKPDGARVKGEGNITNTYRVYASIKTGLVSDPITGKTFVQEKHYESGLGSAYPAGTWLRTKAGIW